MKIRAILKRFKTIFFKANIEKFHFLAVPVNILHISNEYNQ